MSGVPFAYNWRSLLVRPLTNAVTCVGIALVVALVVSVAALAAGLGTAFDSAQGTRSILVTARGSLAESLSALPRDVASTIADTPGVARDERGHPLASPEAVVLWTIPRSDGGDMSVALRGVTETALAARPFVKIRDGRLPQLGTGEAMIGAELDGKSADLAIGRTFHVGRRAWKIVGVFTARGSAFESEIWGDLDGVLADDNRSTYSSVRLEVASGADVKSVINAVEASPRFALRAQTEKEYYEAQSKNADAIWAAVVLVGAVMGIGAVFGAMNTMYASFGARTREVAVLRALGFAKFAIIKSFIFESMLLAIPGGVLGCALAFALRPRSVHVMNLLSLSSVSFRPVLSGPVLAIGMAFALLVGFLGGLWPALAAGRVHPAEALRQ